MGAVFSSARGGDVLRHWAETIVLILLALQNSALTGTFGPRVSIPGAGRWQSWGNAVTHQILHWWSRQGSPHTALLGSGVFPLAFQCLMESRAVLVRGAQGATFYLFFGFFGNSNP